MMEKVELKIEGMSCGHCVGAVRGALDSIEGAEVERVEIGSASVRFDPARTDAARIAGAIEEAGYPVKGPESGS
jgi:copper chaperone